MADKTGKGLQPLRTLLQFCALSYGGVAVFHGPAVGILPRKCEQMMTLP
ncbi:hypothetical protein [Paludibacterium paludis]|nr:hypothetical protein [Paludibacterium paludis]